MTLLFLYIIFLKLNIYYVQATESGWDKVFEVNVKSTFFLIKEVVPYMDKKT